MSIHKDKQAYNLSKRFYGQFHPRTLFYRFFCSSNCIGYIIWIFLRPISFIKLKICYARNGMLFINAWNEWGEGAHLEPDERFGCQYLRNIKQILSKTIETLD